VKLTKLIIVNCLLINFIFGELSQANGNTNNEDSNVKRMEPQSKTIQTSPQLDNPWRVGGRVGFMNQFIRPQFSDWKIDSSFALSFLGDHVIYAEWPHGLQFYLGFELSNYNQVASYKGSTIKYSKMLLELPVGIGYAFDNSNWVVGARFALHLLENIQITFKSNNYNKKLYALAPTNTAWVTELFTEYHFTKEISYNVSYNYEHSTLFFGGVNYVF